jgi:hypothetical protein
MKMGTGDDDSSMDDLYASSVGSEESKDTSGDDETIDQEDQEEMASSSVVPMSCLQGPDGKPVKRGDTVTIKVMDVYGGKDAKICRADAYPEDEDKENPEEEAGETPGQEMSEDEELESLSH